MKKNTLGVSAYLIIAFGMAWALWEVPIRMGVPVQARWAQLVFLPGAFAPAAACFIVRKWITREGFADTGLRPHLRKWPYYLVGWFMPFVTVAFIALAASVLGVTQPDLSLQSVVASLPAHGQRLPEIVRQNLLVVVSGQLAFSALITTPGLWGEEFGWRGYLQLRLFPSRPLLAAVATGIIWGLWHLPLNLRGYNFPVDPVVGMVVFTGSTVLLSIIFGWLRARTGSVWAPSLAHAALNNVGGSLSLLLLPHGDRLLVSALGVLAWIPLGLLATAIVMMGGLKPADATTK